MPTVTMTCPVPCRPGTATLQTSKGLRTIDLEVFVVRGLPWCCGLDMVGRMSTLGKCSGKRRYRGHSPAIWEQGGNIFISIWCRGGKKLKG